jgi:Carboxypeptidase regulatory-like domain
LELSEPHRPGFVRDASVALVSAAVLALLVLYAVAAPSARLTTSIADVVPRPGSVAVVQGRVLEPDGGGLEGARVVVRRGTRTAGSATTDDAGAFRVELPGRCAAYEVSVRAHAVGSSLSTSARRQLCPGDALPVDVRVVTEGHFLWIPGPR